jgi:hypothetical protein
VIAARTLVVVCACVLTTASAFAQMPEDVRRDAQIHLGPLYATPRLAVKEFGIDTNVFNNADARRDFTLTLRPAADVWLPFGQRGLMTTEVSTEVVYYQTYGSERSINPGVRTRGEIFLGRLTPFVEGGDLRTRPRPEQEIDARSLRRETNAQAGLGVRLFSKISLELDAGHKAIAYDEDATYNNVRLQETLNRGTTTVGLAARYAVTPLTTLVLRTESESNRFEFSPLRNSDSWKVVPGVEFKPVALVAGSAHVGIKRFRPTDGSLQRFNGVVARTALSYTLQGATKFTVTAARDLTYSYERLQPYFVVATYGFSVRRQITGPFDATGSVQRDRYTYRDLLLPGATPAETERVDTTRGWSGSVGYRLGRSMRAGVGVMHRSRSSTSLRFRDYSGLRLITTLDYDF